ncbi:helix-turn-helix domain-containing protein [Pluralibacter gergoviae]|uniref:Helix-turn-helix domain-containing protein n=1 Tax=Pluralibacter gergoviae TaxID=61647 RepID=A0AAI9DNX8_PLUGE|nr:helix-turn-helix domain-containing protein [Pluralibacter gergoviae]EKV0932793.1 helix-turn-helix domain-containing protein [Pluralibacter gergoviae]EKV6248049.1 helix-turn-helix domain-containing protein [Pluralibacter gergoviae]EKV9910382.1 helix-turn-helix domain-containing protein [Pluralibacter gergoviae]EKW6620691.1 helix-turn-helix domain-containing protein [Pluralibacter gergoviae]
MERDNMADKHTPDHTRVQVTQNPNFMLSLARGLEVLNAFTPQRQRLTISQLSQKTQISRAAVRRCLYTLAALGMVHSPDGRSYELLPRVLAVGHAYLAGTPLAKVAQHALDGLSKHLHQSCSAATLDGDNILYIARAAVNNLLSVDIGRGSRLPAWATSMGRVLLSALPQEQLELALTRASLVRYTPHTLCDIPGLRDEIARVRMQGYALADRQIELGLCSLAVPLLSRGGQVIAAINVGVPATSMTPDALKDTALAPLRYAAMELSLQL